jgi:hypothetical protein
MLRKRQIVVLFSFVVLMLASIPTALAIDVLDLQVLNWGCEPFRAEANILLTFTGGGEPEPYREVFGVRVLNGDGTVLMHYGFNHTWTPDTDPEPTEFNLIFSTWPTQNPVTIEIIDWDADGNPNGGTWTFEFDSSCVSSPNGNGNHNGADNGNGNHNGAFGTDNGNHGGNG